MKRYFISTFSAILASVCYLVCTLTAYLHYPLPYSLLANWLSDLGNPEVNPQGAIFYNLGICVTALLLVIFFLGLEVWKIENNRVEVIMLRLSQIFGVLGSFSMLMSGIFPINRYDIHATWSTSLYVLLSTAFIFSAAMIRYHPLVPKWLFLLGISTAVFVLMTSFLQQIYVLEWITVLLFLCYVILLGVQTKKVFPVI